MMRLLTLATFAVVAPLNAVAAKDRDCLATVQEFRDVIDCQITEAVEFLIWPEATSQRPGAEPSPMAGRVLSGPCPKYRTYLREVRAEPVMTGRQTISLKAIVTHLAGEHYTGDYQVHKERYVCEMREGEWRILSRHVLQRVDGVNEAAARKYEMHRQPKD